MENVKKQYGVWTGIAMVIGIVIGSVFFTLCGTGVFTFITTGSTVGLENFAFFLILFVIFVGPSVFFYRKDAEALTPDVATGEEETE